MDSNYILFDPKDIQSLLPLAYTRAVADFRTGIFTIKEKWELFLDQTTEVLTREMLQHLYGLDEVSGVRNIYINGCLLPDDKLVEAIGRLKPGQSLNKGDVCLAKCTGEFLSSLVDLYDLADTDQTRHYDGDVNIIRRNWDVFHLNGAQIEADILHVAIAGNGESAMRALAVHQPDQVYIEEGARIEAAIINASAGPIYIGRNAHIMDGAIIRGPVAVCDNAVVKMGAKIYGKSTIGPYCKVGGEVDNSVLFGYSNKGHDGFLGNSVLGEWCNLGADSNTSNLKNNYSSIKSWDYGTGTMVDTGLQFYGLIMGDHSKSGINTMFNTGTVTGVAANIFDGGFPPKFVPSFSWGGRADSPEFRLEKAFEMAEKMMQRRNVEFTEIHRSILKNIFQESASYRKRS